MTIWDTPGFREDYKKAWHMNHYRGNAEEKRAQVRARRSSNIEEARARDRIRMAAARLDGRRKSCPAWHRNNHLKKKYGIDANTWDVMWKSQSGRYAVCSGEVENVPKFPTSAVVDHCHNTGAVRGLLCTRCNLGIGLFLEDPVALLSAVEYLGHHHHTGATRRAH